MTLHIYKCQSCGNYNYVIYGEKDDQEALTCIHCGGRIFRQIMPFSFLHRTSDKTPSLISPSYANCCSKKVRSLYCTPGDCCNKVYPEEQQQKRKP